MDGLAELLTNEQHARMALVREYLANPPVDEEQPE
jgi:hypothetical protein